MLFRDVADDAFEEKHLVGEPQRIAVHEIHLELCGAHFVDHRVDIEPHQLAIVIDMIDDILIFVHGFKAIGLARGFRPARLAGRRRQRKVGVGVLRDEIEFDLGCDDRLPTLVLVKAQHLFQDRPRRDVDLGPVAIIGIGNHEGRRRGEARRDADGIGIGKQDLVGILVPDIVDILGIMAVDRADEDAAGDAQRLVLDRSEEFLGGQNLAALHPVDVGNDTFDFVDIMVADPLFQID